MLESELITFLLPHNSKWYEQLYVRIHGLEKTESREWAPRVNNRKAWMNLSTFLIPINEIPVE